ncbi:MAG: energy-coupled thiamine transporter ThiT [Ruminococcaceae bacterium]|nr:energy-coupled thiamine transporter ThiT [Oscillospiraceae bacterium]
MMRSKKTQLLVEAAVMIALATVLSMIKVYEAPFGGSVTLLSMAPIIVLSMRRGIKVGLAGAFVYSVLQLVLGIGSVAYVPTAWGIVLCILFDYILPFTLLGLGGLFRDVHFSDNQGLNTTIAAILGTLLVTLLRFLCHIVSGAVIWYALDLQWYADDPTHIVHQYGAWMFSLIYNGTFMIPEIIETVVGVPILTAALRKFKVR